MNDISIIIPTLNEQDYIPLLLTSLSIQHFDGKLQVIVVDGNSADETASIVSKFGDQFGDLSLLSTPPNVGHQRNLGAKHAKYNYLMFLDADVILPANFLHQLDKQINGEENFIAAILHLAPHMNIFDCLALTLVYVLFFLSWVSGTPVVNGDFILITKPAHERINGFKEGAVLGEDTDYGVRSVRAGAKYRFFFHPHILASDRRVRQYGRVSLIKVWSKAFLRARKDGPTYSGVDYPFGNYKEKDGKR